MEVRENGPVSLTQVNDDAVVIFLVFHMFHPLLTVSETPP
jgi:hypothetical protein